MQRAIISKKLNNLLLRNNASRIVNYFSTANGKTEINNNFLVTETVGNICILKMAKAPVNTFDIDMMNLFQNKIVELEEDPHIQGLVLTSAYDGIFSAGLDLKYLANPTPSDFKLFWSTFESMWKTLYLTPLATVAAINGSSPALGAVMALSTDYRIFVSNPKFKFGLNETSLGMIPPLWLQEMTARTIGLREAELHLGHSSMVSPEDALRIGYVDELSTSDALLDAATKKCSNFTKIPIGSRSDYKMYQRKAIGDMAGQASVDMMAENILGDEFQLTIKKIMDGLKKKKK